jgi:hypothetical protein
LLLTDLLRICGDILPSAILDLNLEFIITTPETEPLTEFTGFGEFPLEIRRLIWTTSCMVTRLIEIESNVHSTTPLTISPGKNLNIHSGFGLTFSSRHPAPALFYVSKEAHSEAKTVYKLVNFNSYRPEGPSPHPYARKVWKNPMWFNPLADIVYFGDHVCLGTMISVLQTGIEIHRVAVDVRDSSTGGNFYTCSCSHGDSVPSILQPTLGPQIDLLTRQLRVLHGFALAGSTEKVFPGCPALNEVIVFMKEAGPFDHDIQDFDACAGFKNYTADAPHYPLVGITRLTADAYTEYQSTTALAPFDTGAIVWKGDKKPTIQLARRSQAIPVDQHFEILAINLPGLGQHRMVWWKVREFDTRREHHTHSPSLKCSLFPNVYSGPGDYLFKFMGSREDVDWVIGEVLREVARGEKLFKQEMRIVDPTKAVFPATIAKTSL